MACDWLTVYVPPNESGARTWFHFEHGWERDRVRETVN